MPPWQTPDGFSGNAEIVRIASSDVSFAAANCPLQTAVKIRPALRPIGPRRYNLARPRVATSLLRRRLDAIEFDDPTESDDPAQEGYAGSHALARWTSEAVGNCQSAARRTAGTEAGLLRLEPVSQDWARCVGAQTSNGATGHEEVVDGRRYAGDGVRELRLLRRTSVTRRARNEAEIAFAAAVTADARRVLNKRWRAEPLILSGSDPVERVRVIEIGCSDGSANILFDDSPDAANADYLEHVAPLLPSLTAGSTRLPGPGCVWCPMLEFCPVVPSRPGLLGTEKTSPHRRTWSVSTARQHASCGVLGHLAARSMPGDLSAEETAASMRGRAVHAWIERNHRREPPRPCGCEEVPDTPDAWSADGVDISGPEARLGVQIIGDHSLVCPVGGMKDGGSIRSEQYVVAYDGSADVLVVAKTDTLYETADGWVLRETKTTRGVGQGDLLRHYPQLALAVVLSAEGVLPGGPGGCRVELERLTSRGPVLSRIDVRDPHVVAAAREAVANAVDGWIDVIEPAARPLLKTCRTCAYARWCPATKREGAA